LLLPLPPPRPSALSQEQKAASRLGTERQIGAPIDRKHSPTYSVHAQSGRSQEAAPSGAVQGNSKRGNYYVRDSSGRGYYVVPRNGGRAHYVPYQRSRTFIPPSFDWRLFR
jgi:hypothetical protein